MVPAFAQGLDAGAPAAPKTTLVVPDAAHPWAAAQIGSALQGDISYQEGSLLQALAAAKAGAAVGVVEIRLDTSAAFESGRVVCYSPEGRKLWEEKVMFNLGGGEERIARRFVDALEKKVEGKRCSQPSA
ncbi:hypothetical protein ASD53_18770 [Lysobacter sp. Root559]|nr:hypothetical protein ASD53_18770 [Lysobacter sp. Root559]